MPNEERCAVTQEQVDAISQAIAEEQPTQAVKDYLGEHFEAMNHFGQMLREEGELRGLIGPRELPRLWSRHLLNCAAVADTLPTDVKDLTVADVGSGGGLPGIVISIMRPDANFYLIEPMDRRIAWLTDVINELDLDNVELLQTRSQELPRKVKFDVVTSRAVANLSKLATICGRLVAGGGQLLALKGRKAAEEIEAASANLKKMGLINPEIIEVPNLMDDEPSRIVRLTKKQ